MFKIHQGAGKCTLYCANYYEDGKRTGILMDASDWKEALENILDCFCFIDDNDRICFNGGTK